MREFVTNLITKNCQFSCVSFFMSSQDWVINQKPIFICTYRLSGKWHHYLFKLNQSFWEVLTVYLITVLLGVSFMMDCNPLREWFSIKSVCLNQYLRPSSFIIIAFWCITKVSDNLFWKYQISLLPFCIKIWRTYMFLNKTLHIMLEKCMGDDPSVRLPPNL